MLSGEKSINAGYKELTHNKTGTGSNTRKEMANIPSAAKQTAQKTQISEETKKICADLKTEKIKEYVDSIWDYKVAIIECMNTGFNRYYGGFASILKDMNNRVTETELKECIQCAEKIAHKMLKAIEAAKITTKLKLEE